jgi:S1-C subfamily serine protease
VLNKKRPGEFITVTAYRGGKKIEIPVKLGERPGA